MNINDNPAISSIYDDGSGIAGTCPGGRGGIPILGGVEKIGVDDGDNVKLNGAGVGAACANVWGADNGLTDGPADGGSNDSG